MQIVAEIIYSINKNGTGVKRVHCDDYDAIYDCLMEIIKGNHDLSSDAANWCELATIGEEYDVEKFNIEIIEIENGKLY